MRTRVFVGLSFLAVVFCFGICLVSEAAGKPELQLRARVQQEEDLSKLPIEVDVTTKVVGDKVEITQRFMFEGMAIGPQRTMNGPNDPRIVNAMVESWKKSRLDGQILLFVPGAWATDSGIIYPDKADVKRVLKINGTISGIKNDGFKITGDNLEEGPQLKETGAEGKFEFELTIPAKTGALSFQGKDAADKAFEIKYAITSYPELVYKEGKISLQPEDIFLVPIAKDDKQVIVTGDAKAIEQLQPVGATGGYVVLKAKAAGKAVINVQNEAGAKRVVVEVTVAPGVERTKSEYVKPTNNPAQ